MESPLKTPAEKPLNYLSLFWAFVKIGALTFGGGLSMIPILEREVTGKGWLSQEEFVEMLTITNIAPGPFAINSSAYIGYKLKGILGAIVCVLGNILVPVVLILLIAALLLDKLDKAWLDRFFNGARPAVVALILAAGLRLGKGIPSSAVNWLLALITLVGVVFLKLNPIFLILGGALAGIGMGYVTKADPDKHKREGQG